MTIGDYPEYLAVGFLANQRMLGEDETVTGVDFDAESEAIVVRTDGLSNYEDKLAKKTRTSGCAVGTVFGDMMEGLDKVRLPKTEVQLSWLRTLSKTINTTPSLYLHTGAIHGTVLCEQDRPLVYMEDVGRHNAVDKVAGWMRTEGVTGDDKILYTTGRLTSEMVIKTALMGYTGSCQPLGVHGLGGRDRAEGWLDRRWAHARRAVRLPGWCRPVGLG